MPKNRKNRKPKASPEEAQPSSSRPPRGNSGDRTRDDHSNNNHHAPAQQAGSGSHQKQSSGGHQDRDHHQSGKSSPEKHHSADNSRNSYKERGSGSNSGNITTLMGKVNISAPGPLIRPISRPGFGTIGNPVTLETNYFKLRFSSKQVISQYSVSVWLRRHPDHVDPAKRKSRGKPQSSREDFDWVDVSHVEPIPYNRNVFDLVHGKYSEDFGCKLAYDGRAIAYAPHRIRDNALNTFFKVNVGKEGGRPTAEETKEGRVEEVRMRFVHAKDLRVSEIVDSTRDTLGSVEILAAFDNVLASSPRKHFVQIGRSFFSSQGSKPLGRYGSTCSAWRGFYQSARLTQQGLLVNLDESFTAFWNRGGEPLMSLMQDGNDNRVPRADDGRAFNQLAMKLKNLKIRARHTGITYKFHGFTRQSADNITFDSDKGKVSISEYFARNYNIRLKHGNYPCVKAHPKRDIYIPLELCMVLENQRMLGLLTPEQTSTMVRTASTRPMEKRKAAIEAMRMLDHNRDPLCRDFGITVETNPVKVRGRILPPPKMLYSGKRIAQPSQGSWRCDQPFYVPAKLKTWLVIAEGKNPKDPAVLNFVKEIMRAAHKGGMEISNPVLESSPMNKVPKTMYDIAQRYRVESSQWNCEYKLQLILIIKDRQDARTYGDIKKMGDLDLGIASQVCLAKNIRNPRGLSMYCDNVILKVNSKLGGQNWVVSPYNNLQGIPDIPFLNTPHMILGADVTHPMPGSRTPSVAALVGSRDREGIQYSASIRNQPGRQEVITEIGNMFKEVYQNWMNNFGNKYHVNTIVMFRDGVSEGQFEEVMTKEVQALRSACLQVASGCKPKITYIIVTKRHHTRFFAEQKYTDRSGNVLPGTVVDRDVTSSEYYDFYVNSHAGIQGTSKPSKYTVLIDENRIPVNVLQAYVFRLAHGFVRCNRSVSMVNSAFYAHLLAFRGRIYMGEDLETKSTGSSSDSVPKTPELGNFIARRLFFV